VADLILDRPTTRVTLLNLAALLLLATAVAIGRIATQSWVLRRRMACLFARHQADEPSLDTLNARLQVFRSSRPVIQLKGIERANVYFRGHLVSILRGYASFYRASSITGLISWSHRQCLFAVATESDKDWMRRNTDVFLPAYQNGDVSVFWIRQVGPLLA